MADVPGGVYLCQVSEDISCGACCGLYNVANGSFESLMEMLDNRSQLFAKTPRHVDAIVEFKQAIESIENQQRPYPKFHHCPFLGLVGKNYSRVGCLLHPLASGNRGIDFRGLSYYGGMACRMYFCPTYRNVARDVKIILKEAAPNWYIYGLVITEAMLIQHFFSEVAKKLGTSIQATTFIEAPQRLKSITEFMKMKVYWPFRGKYANRQCHYFFDDGLYPKPQVNYEAIGAFPSDYDGIFKEMVSDFASVEQLEQAEALVKDAITRCSRFI